jgi:NAD(P)-dependent dehydrogenase (short-subunit alcohol dehydrogenase family)
VSVLTVQYAKVKFNAVEPGFTATDFTAGIDGGRPVEQSALSELNSSQRK